MKKIELSADKLVNALLSLPNKFQISLLDSCGVNYLDSRYLLAGIKPLETFYLADKNPQTTLDFLDRKLAIDNLFNFFTVSYDFGLKLEKIKPRKKEFSTFSEPDIYLAVYDVLIFHDYNSGETFLTGNEKKFDETLAALENAPEAPELETTEKTSVSTNYTKLEYLKSVEKIQEFIRRGDTYQTNFTQQFRAKLPESVNAEKIFRRLRKNNPAPFAAFLKRKKDAVVSTSPERFFCIGGGKIQTSPIKGTKRRGTNTLEDEKFKTELLNSQKDLAENTMIVDLLRNDLGRVCRFGSVEVEKLCEMETHPTFFHLVSTVSGELKKDIKFSDILKAVFPCGSITGAPKINTMKIIDHLETADRGLSMGAIGFSAHGSKIDFQNSLDLSVAIRTMVVKDNEAVFNVGGGIVIDSTPENEYEEVLTKARAIFGALNADLSDLPK